MTTNFGGGVVPLLGAIVVCYGGGRGLWGVDVVPLLGAIAGANFCYIFLLYSGPPISRRRPRKQQ